MRAKALALVLVYCVASPALGDITVPNADGSDGALNVTSSNLVIDLSLAGTQPDWESTTNGTPTHGVYDPNRWAIIFRYSSVNINSGRTVTFINHESRAPVVWLVDGNVTINGTLVLDGKDGHLGIAQGGTVFVSQPGPGGFRGGVSRQPASPQSAGYGPGGSRNANNDQYPNGASHAAAGSGTNPASAGPQYGSALCNPLVGGSGSTSFLRSSGVNGNDGGGGAGGGAILIAATQSITVGTSGQIRADGGRGVNQASGGSGGTIRLVSDQVTGSGNIFARGGTAVGFDGSVGRIRIETNLPSSLNPIPLDPETFAIAGTTAVLWPPVGSPTIRVASIDGHVVGDDPLATIDFPASDILMNNPNSVPVLVDCANVPISSVVTVRAVLKNGQDVNTTATFVSGDVNASIWQALVQLPDGYSVIQARAILP